MRRIQPGSRVSIHVKKKNVNVAATDAPSIKATHHEGKYAYQHFMGALAIVDVLLLERIAALTTQAVRGLVSHPIGVALFANVLINIAALAITLSVLGSIVTLGCSLLFDGSVEVFSPVILFIIALVFIICAIVVDFCIVWLQIGTVHLPAGDLSVLGHSLPASVKARYLTVSLIYPVGFLLLFIPYIYWHVYYSRNYRCGEWPSWRRLITHS